MTHIATLILVFFVAGLVSYALTWLANSTWIVLAAQPFVSGFFAFMAGGEPKVMITVGLVSAAGGVFGSWVAHAHWVWIQERASALRHSRRP